MKITDFALIFVAIFFPMMLIAYINTSFAVKAEKNEMYYKSIINAATQDAVNAMKQVENSNIDYGYSGIVDKKVSINADVAIDSFFKSLAHNFGIEGNRNALESLKMYIPVIAIIDYDGIYIHSLEETTSGGRVFKTKPKVRYTYTYAIQKKTVYPSGNSYRIIDVTKVTNLYNLLTNYIYEITFTMDDYVYLNIYSTDTKKLVSAQGFYLTDENNNSNLVFAENIVSEEKKELKANIIKHLAEKRQDTIASIGMEHISYAINKHNDYAKAAGINYTFTFNVESDEEWYATMNGIGMISVIQGISLGNKYLNYKSYSASELKESKKYYVSVALDEDKTYIRAYLQYNLYHAYETCPIYEYYISRREKVITPTYYLSRADAATQGYYSCPICKP